MELDKIGSLGDGSMGFMSRPDRGGYPDEFLKEEFKKAINNQKGWEVWWQEATGFYMKWYPYAPYAIPGLLDYSVGREWFDDGRTPMEYAMYGLLDSAGQRITKLEETLDGLQGLKSRLDYIDYRLVKLETQPAVTITACDHVYHLDRTTTALNNVCIKCGHIAATYGTGT